jgi:type IV pilus assembly protein PilA
MSLAWYYADRQRQQQGPVADSWLRNAFERGELPANTLVWREGMAQWLPLSQVASELGLTIANAPPAMPENYRPRPVAPAKSGAGCLVIGIVLAIGFVMVIGILAAIALPAYQDYTVRARVSGAIIQSSQLKAAVSEFYLNNERCPVNDDEGFGSATSYATKEVASINISSIDGGQCAVQILFNDLGPADTKGAEVLYTMDSNQQWTESSTLPAKYLPTSMRN